MNSFDSIKNLTNLIKKTPDNLNQSIFVKNIENKIQFSADLSKSNLNIQDSSKSMIEIISEHSSSQEDLNKPYMQNNRIIGNLCKHDDFQENKQEKIEIKNVNDKVLKKSSSSDSFENSPYDSALSLSIKSIKKIKSLECIDNSVDISFINLKEEPIIKKEKNSKIKSTKIVIDEIPKTKNKVGIFHMDSMPLGGSREEYYEISKVIKHILNFLLIKELNARLKNIQINYSVKVVNQQISKIYSDKQDNSDFKNEESQSKIKDSYLDGKIFVN
jgi:hypothetical protein